MGIHLGSPFKIPLYLHWSWLVFMGVLFIFQGLGAIFWVAAFTFVIFHEYGHCLAAKYVGFEVKQVVMLPIGGVAEIKGLGTDAKKDLFIIICGPLVNVVLFVFFYISYFFIEDPVSIKVLGNFCLINLMLAVFNLLPIYPLDGGRIFCSILKIITGNNYRSTQIAVRLGQFLACCMIVLGLILIDPIFILLFMFVIMLGQQELRHAEFLRRLTVVRCKIATILDDPNLMNASIAELIAVLEDVQDQEVRALLNADELIPMLESLNSGVLEGRSRCLTTT